MGKSQHDIDVLCKKYLDRSISEEEMVEMLTYFKHHGIPKAFDQILNREFSKKIGDAPAEEVQDITDKVKLNLTSYIASKKRSIRYRWLAYAAAAVIVGMLLFSWFILIPQKVTDTYVAAEMDIAPGGNKATIMLADGRVLTLDNQHDGIIMDGQDITYSDGRSRVSDLRASSAPQLLTLTTPRGGMYKVKLSDGTTVWLNAESTLRYPTHFSGGDRVVELEGEAYFDVKRVADETVAHNFQPFKVLSANQTIAVLGTEFNVSAYADEDNTKTTLIDGKVRIESAQDRENITLHPGEQGVTGHGGLTKNKVDVGDYIDWKNGEFVFRNETAKEVLHRIARWYDIDIDYSKYLLSDEVFSGSISRYSNLQTVLRIMQEAGDLAFEIENRTVMVRNKMKN